MKRVYDAKKKYEEIEIPSELGERVSAAIAQSKLKKKKGFAFYTKVLAAPVAVCAVICVAVAVNGNRGAPPIESDEKTVADATDDVAVVEVTKSARMAPMNDVCQPTAGTERMNEEVTENNSSVIYSGETYISISCTDEQGNIKYLNFTQVGGEDISLQELGIEGYDDGTPFYISSDDTVVVILDGVEKEFEINRG